MRKISKKIRLISKLTSAQSTLCLNDVSVVKFKRNSLINKAYGSTIDESFKISDIQREENMSVLLITHDLGVVAETCEKVAVMYKGKIIEEASVNQIFKNPQHEYTKALIEAIPKGGKERLKVPDIGEPGAI